MRQDQGIPRIRLRDSLDAERELLLELREVVLTHPLAAQAAFSALALEGQRYAQTDRGAAQLKKLKSSPFIQRVRLAFELTSGWMVEEEAVDITPSSLIDGLFMAAGQDDLEALLDSLYDSQSSP